MLTQNNKYVGSYYYNNRYTITLKQDGTCDFTERGIYGYTDGKMKCFYKIQNESVVFDRDVRRYSYEEDNFKAWGDVWVPGQGCEEYKNHPGTCDEETVRIQETAAIGETGIIYNGLTYIKL